MATPPKKPLRPLDVIARRHVTPNMIRVTLAAEWVKELPAGIEGAHCKIFLPSIDQSKTDFLQQLSEGPRPTVRTYTIRYIRPAVGEMDVDFVDHGDAGPASAWARKCMPGDVCGFAGPGPIKLKTYFADFYVVAADMSALPVAAATLEAMPKDAKGIAFLEVTGAEDRQDVNNPDGVELHWLIHPDPHQPATQSIKLIEALPKFEGSVQTCIAGESGMIKALRTEILSRRGIPKENAYISGYWKIGLVEDEHQEVKRAEAATA
ncbi:siderophore-interacting protein [Yoonia sp. BS5-3]|uniref:Siderophore-interacting protein n=1 Tax=Yoonia phaeophyticola TaxID=3137369 RepID=A0ABZ2V7R4_9RHOB